MDPTHYGRIHESDSTLRPEIAYIAIAELVSDVPSDSLDDEQMIKVAAFEERRNIRKGFGHINGYPRPLAIAPEPAYAGQGIVATCDLSKDPLKMDAWRLLCR